MTPAIGAWLRERFPARNAVFFLALYLAALVVARAAVAPGAVTITWRDAAGFAAVWCFFLTLRIADEHKDFAADAVAHPQRVLQRGLITLRHLRLLGMIAVAAQVGISLWLDGGVGPVTRAWLLVFGWSALMTREFFAGAWLRAHRMVYALSHLLVMPLVAFWIATMGAPGAVLMPAVQSFAALAFLAAMACEMARKLRAPGDEHPLAESYTQALGIPRAAVVLISVVLAATSAAVLLTHIATGDTSMADRLALGACAIAATGALLRFVRRPTAAAAAVSEAAVGLAALATQLVPLAAVLASRGVAPGVTP